MIHIGLEYQILSARSFWVLRQNKNTAVLGRLLDRHQLAGTINNYSLRSIIDFTLVQMRRTTRP